MAVRFQERLTLGEIWALLWACGPMAKLPSLRSVQVTSPLRGTFRPTESDPARVTNAKEELMQKLLLTLFVWQLTAVDKLKTRREAGQGTLEYVGMIAVAAIIIVAVVAVAKSADIGSMLTAAINKVKAAVG